MYGYYNKLLRINLTARNFSEEDILDDVLEKHLGGKGLGAYLMLKEIQPGIDPLSEKNKLIFTVGPLTGSQLWGSSRYSVFAKSPLTGIFGESYSGGKVAPCIKACGCDAIIIEGKSDQPTYLEISQAKVTFHDASHLWGKDTYQSEDAVLAEVGVSNAQAVVIGPAGENMVRFAVMENNYWRSAGRCGMGAVCGSKKLKGIVFHGQANCEFADTDLLKKLIRDLSKKSRENLRLPAKIWRERGTVQTVELANTIGCFPTRYWSQGRHEHWKNLSAEYMLENFEVKCHACPNCFLACGNITTVKQGPYKGLTIEGPEFETIYALGGLNCLEKLEDVAYLNDICDRLGMDTMTAGNVTAFAIEAYKRGKIDYDVDYGQTEKIAHLLKLIATREEVGELLAKGVRTASQELGLEHLAVHVKGLEPGGYDPRVLKGVGLQYAVSSRGACHMRGTFHSAEMRGLIAPDAIEGKAKLFLENENKDVLFDSFILCRFFRSFYEWDELVEVIRATTGLIMSQEDIKKTAQHITTQARLFNVREGISKKDDTLPARFFKEPLGPEGKRITEEELNTMRQEYYRLHGWNDEGIPI